jgi:hypothetical protein
MSPAREGSRYGAMRSSNWLVTRFLRLRGRISQAIGGVRRRVGGSEAGGFRTEAQFLQSQGIELTRRTQAIGRLEFPHRVDGRIIPLAAGCTAQGSFPGESVLNFTDAFRGGRSLSLPFLVLAFPATGILCASGTSRLRGCGCLGMRRFLGLRGLALRRDGGHTEYARRQSCEDESAKISLAA